MGFSRYTIEEVEREISPTSNWNNFKFSVGDFIIIETLNQTDKKKNQTFEGIVIAKRNRSFNSSFIVRKASSGFGIERTFQLHSPLISKVTVKKLGNAKRSKLYYLRSKVGKSMKFKK
ncbi:50S ribosomal protein L19 [Candidatus Tremblaya phenacola]|uniref:50S ribosomal protein L19 n=1 Tax=Candidatus Tremblayella phenacoccinincola TaxID=1010676 RepID=UPI00132F6F82|nr:50S ribosomal protein L19 [Candidatus Tremblaya phenacola]KAH0998324.1 LSU ribosomal protein L19p [Candidatus Tremblaya phenacola]